MSILHTLVGLIAAAEVGVTLASLALGIKSRNALGAAIFWALQTVSLAATIVGWFLLLPLSAFKLWHTAPSLHFPRSVTVWNGGYLTWIWGNEEDGVLPDARNNYMTWAPDWLRAYVWSAWRNSANNLRFVCTHVGGPWLQVRRWGWYFQAGFRPDTGWPVLSAGPGLGTQT